MSLTAVGEPCCLKKVACDLQVWCEIRVVCVTTCDLVTRYKMRAKPCDPVTRVVKRCNAPAGAPSLPHLRWLAST